MTACGGKKPSNEIIIHKTVAAKPARVKKMGDYKQQAKVEWDGEEYTLDFDFHADTTLAKAKDGAQEYYDNRTTLRILRPDGTEFMRRDFSKSDFEGSLSGDIARDGAFLGLVFDKVEGGKLVFAASVGSPDKLSDEYVPFTIKISRGGSVAITRSTQIDTSSAEANSADYDDDGV